MLQAHQDLVDIQVSVDTVDSLGLAVIAALQAHLASAAFLVILDSLVLLELQVLLVVRAVKEPLVLQAQPVIDTAQPAQQPIPMLLEPVVLHPSA